jgi:hypothetical protein
MAKKLPAKRPAAKRKSSFAADERTARLQQKILHIITYRDRAKKAYSKSGTLLNELLREMEIGEQIQLPDGRIVTLEDAFANTNYVYRQTSFTRVDIKISG